MFPTVPAVVFLSIHNWFNSHSISLILRKKVAMEHSDLKAELHQLIDQVNDDKALYQVRSILEAQTGHDWADDISDEMREALERSIAQADAGNVISHEDVMKMLREKYGQ
jgi:hypothetical protein